MSMNHLKVMTANNAAMKEVREALEADSAPPSLSPERPVEVGGLWDIILFLIFIGAVLGFTKFKRDGKKTFRNVQEHVPSTPRKGVTFCEDGDDSVAVASSPRQIKMGMRGSGFTLTRAPTRGSASGVSSASSSEPCTPKTPLVRALSSPRQRLTQTGEDSRTPSPSLRRLNGSDASQRFVLSTRGSHESDRMHGMMGGHQDPDRDLGNWGWRRSTGCSLSQSPPQSDVSDTGCSTPRKARKRSRSPRNADYKRMNEEMMDAFNQSPEQAFKVVKGWLDAEKSMNPVNISAFLHRYGKAKNVCPPEILSKLADEADKWNDWGLISLSGALHGLHLQLDSPEVRKFIKVLTPKVEMQEGEFNSQATASSIYGLQRCGNCPEARALLAVLAGKLNKTTQTFTAQGIANSYYGLIRVEDCPEARTMLLALANKTNESECDLLFNEYCVSMSGLQTCGGSQEALAALNSLNAKALKIKTKQIESRDIPRLMHGLSQFKDCPEVRTSLEILTSRLSRHHHAVTGNSLSVALYGLYRCGGSPQTKKLVHLLAKKVDDRSFSGPNAPYGGDVAAGIFGLQKFEDCDEIRELLSRMVESLEKSKLEFKPDAIASALTGLRNISTSAAGRKMMKILLAKIPKAKDGTYTCPCDANPMVEICVQFGHLQDSEELREFIDMAAKLVKDAKVHMKPELFAKASDGLKRVTECPELDRLRAALAVRAAAPWTSSRASSASSKIDLLAPVTASLSLKRLSLRSSTRGSFTSRASSVGTPEATETVELVVDSDVPVTDKVETGSTPAEISAGSETPATEKVEEDVPAASPA